MLAVRTQTAFLGGRSVAMMMSDSTVEGCYDSQSHALRQKCRPPGQLTPRGFHRCSAYGTWPAPARLPHPKAKGALPLGAPPRPRCAPEGRLAGVGCGSPAACCVCEMMMCSSIAEGAEVHQDPRRMS